MDQWLSMIVLATGSPRRDQGPGPFDPVCGQPLVKFAIDAAADLPVDRIVVVVGRGSDDAAKRLNELSPQRPIESVEQATARGSGDAVALALTALADDLVDLEESASVLVVPGAAALVRPQTLTDLVVAHGATTAAATLLTFTGPDQTGDVRRDRDGRIVALDDQETGAETASGIGVYRRSLLGAAVRRLSPRYSFGESCFADVVEVLAEAGHRIGQQHLADPSEAMAADDHVRLARVESALRERINLAWLSSGVTMVDPDHTYIDAPTSIGRGTHILPGCTLAGACHVGADVRLGPDVHLTDCAIGDRAAVRSATGTDAEIGPGADVGPYAVLRPGAQIPGELVTGPFYAADSSAD
ncbi:MAG: NTP transferase domain-containing protein [Acidimicrobiia bacterium]|nr:NTP transferase domain-containing protein [Acidimicrobiia bacterium]MDH5237223.1 NTP transferase domain-containing protein [Acidimicrobiia bacterium]